MKASQFFGKFFYAIFCCVDVEMIIYIQKLLNFLGSFLFGVLVGNFFLMEKIGAEVETSARFKSNIL
jgi:hypothetical protein